MNIKKIDKNLNWPDMGQYSYSPVNKQRQEWCHTRIVSYRLQPNCLGAAGILDRLVLAHSSKHMLISYKSLFYF